MFKFSVVIPCFNSSNEIRRTLDSVFSQTFTDFEVIIIDDCSNDIEKLSVVIDEYQSKYGNIKTFYSKVKLNGSGARNKGVEISSGEYIALLDSDDEWKHNKLLKYAKEIEHNKYKKIIYYSKLEILENSNLIKKMPLRSYDSNKESMASYIFGVAGFIQTSTIVLRKEDYQNIKFNDQFIRHQDYDFCIRADKLGYDFYFIPEELTIYNIQGRSNSKRKGESTIYSHWWLNSMRPYLSDSDLNCYKSFKLPHKLKSDGKKIKAILCFFYCFMKTSLGQKKDFINFILNKVFHEKY